jgi:Protein of unknown function (DUF3800)
MSVKAVSIYLDESGDLGWKFDAPYLGGGSSRYLTITALCVPPGKDHFVDRAIRRMYEKYHWPPGKERKWVQLSANQRTEFAEIALELLGDHHDIAAHAIVVKKQNVADHIRSDGNKLYNYMIKLALLKKMATFDHVTFVPDPRSIKVKSGNSLNDYLQTELWFTEKVTTTLVTKEVDSSQSRGIQFADMLAGIVQARFERNQPKDFDIIQPRLSTTNLFF